MREDEIIEQTRQGVCDAQLLVILDRIRARELFCQHHLAAHMRESTSLRCKTLQDVYDEAFFGELEERFRCRC